MAMSKEHRIFSRSFTQADSSNDDNVIRNVSLITKGEAKGHGCQIDDETISGLFEAAKVFKNGVRANLGHFTGMENCFGHVTNLRIAGDKLLGDLNLFSEHKDFALIKKQITTISDTFGFSVFFDGPDEEVEQEIDGMKVKVAFARCSPNCFYSADLVDCPAANPSGVFDRKFISGPTARGQIDESTVDAKKDNMEDAKEAPDLKKEISDMLAKHADHMSKMNDRMDEMCERMAIGTNDTSVKKDEDAAELQGKEGKTKDSSPENPGGSSMSEGGEDKTKDEEKKDDKKDLSRRSSDPKALAALKSEVKAELMDEMLKSFAAQKKSPPATATVTSASDGGSNGKHTFKTYHEACRHVLSECKSNMPKTEAMKLAAQRYPELYKAYTRGQLALSRGEGGEWTKEAIFMTPEKHERRLSIIANGGRLT